MLRHLLIPCVLIAGGGLSLGEIKAGGEILSQALLAPEKEIELALKAGPAHLRSGATVFVFGKHGYEKARTGTNGFNCMVNRDGIQNGDTAVHPTCWDPEGSRTILPVMLRVGELLAQQKSAAEITRDIDEGFAQGRFHSPAKTGIAYMLAGDVKFDPKSGQLSTTEFPAHYMIYAPGVTNADIGMTKEATTPGLPFVYSGYSGGSRTAYIIVMAGAGGHAMP
ncbi:MAG TPA: hypothetical protein VK582_06150 [Pyrinomonadaceae bacterium]|nr:hypothetical protein [Pyrinomonadaceae bacterium]